MADASHTPPSSAGPRVAIVHDYLNQYGGAERVVLALSRLYPRAPIYTSLYDRERLGAEFASLDVRTTFMQRLPGASRHHQAYLPVYPLAFETLRVRGYDVILSSSSAWAKAVRPPAGVPHICYCHSPMRFAWNLGDYLQGERVPGPARVVLPLAMAGLRRWDRWTAKRVTAFVANSHAVADRVRRFYGRDATVIHPPVETGRFQPTSAVEDWFLVVQRLVPYKRLDRLVEAFNALQLPLRIVGDGRARPDLERLAGPTVRFLGRLSDAELAAAYARCRAYIVPGEEDFAIAPVEAQAAGRPVIALGRGGVLDTVLPGTTGVFYQEPSVAALVEAVRRFEGLAFNPAAIRAHALAFDTAVFQRKIDALVRHWWTTGTAETRAAAQARVR